MNWPVIRCLFGVAGGVALGVAIAALLPVTGLSVRWFGVALAISAFCVIAVYAVKAIEKDHARNRITITGPPWYRVGNETRGTVTKVIHRPARATTVIKGGKRRRWWQW